MSAPSGRLWLLDDQEAREEGAEHVDYGADYHPSFQQVAFVDQDTGERRLNHSLSVRGIRVRVWMEAPGVCRS
jgi:hypothetical protein